MPGLRERHMDRTRAAIVDAALALFQEQGFTETTIDAIAERADVGRRTVFRYFPAKGGVFFPLLPARGLGPPPRQGAQARGAARHPAPPPGGRAAVRGADPGAARL